MSCIQRKGKKLLVIYEFQDPNLSYAKAEKATFFSNFMGKEKEDKRKSLASEIESKNPCLSMLKLPY